MQRELAGADDHNNSVHYNIALTDLKGESHMSSFKEFLEKMQQDEEFAKKVNDAAVARREAGASTANEILIPVAEEFGYPVTEEELNAYIELQKSQAQELNEEEMGKVSGGFLVLATVALSLAGLSLASVTIAEQFVDKKEDKKE